MSSAPLLPTVVTTREHGYDVLRPLVKADELRRIRRGAYVDAPVATDWWERERQELLAQCVAVHRQLTSRYAFSHTTAAVLRGWPVPPGTSRVEIVQDFKQTRVRHDDVRRHTSHAFIDGTAEVTHIAGLPVTGALDTVLDCLRVLHPRDGLVLVDAALADLAAVDLRDREGTMARLAALHTQLTTRLADIGRARGVVRARHVLAHADGLSGSPGESRVRWIALVTGLPVPVCQWEVNAAGRVFYSDLAWPVAKPERLGCRAVTFEYDGELKYDGEHAADAIANEKLRQDAISSTGVEVHRITRARLADPAACGRWMVTKFPASVRRSLTPRPELDPPRGRT